MNQKTQIEPSLNTENYCPYCNGTGDIHSIDGEWRGQCTECKPKSLRDSEELLMVLPKLREVYKQKFRGKG